MEKHILLVEDEEHIVTGLIFNLELEGYKVTHAKDGNIAKNILFEKNNNFSLIILDVMLPEINGFDLCYALRKKNDFTPVLMLTAKKFDKDKIYGLQMGADDYITKPFNLEELLTRIEVLLRRQKWNNKINNSINELFFGDNYINFDSLTAKVSNIEIKLTNLEFRLLKVLAENENRVISREELLEKVWEIKDYLNLRTVDNFIMRLRKYFEKDPSKPVYFHSFRGIGYKFTKYYSES
ncbi:MAG: response regulator transcription factor [Candidatus Sericytochromatia bacterium]